MKSYLKFLSRNKYFAMWPKLITFRPLNRYFTGSDAFNVPKIWTLAAKTASNAFNVPLFGTLDTLGAYKFEYPDRNMVRETGCSGLKTVPCFPSGRGKCTISCSQEKRRALGDALLSGMQ